MKTSTIPRRRTLTTLAAGLAVCLALTGCGQLSRDGAPAEVVIAADLPLSGEAVTVGVVLEQALRLRVEQANQQRLLPGHELRLVVRDNGSRVSASVANLTELAADPQVHMLVTGGCAACVVEAAPVLATAGVPTVALAAGESVAAPVSERRYVFQLAPRAGDTAELLVSEAARLGAEHLALVTSEADGYGPEAERELTAAAESAGLTVVARERVAGEPEPERLADLAGRLASWRPEPVGLPFPPGPEQPATGPDAVVLCTPPAVATRVAVALRQAGWRGELLLDASAAGSLFLTGDAAERRALSGARLVFTETLAVDQTIAGSPARAARQAWWRDYVARYGGYDAYSSFAADAVGLLVAAVARTGSVDRAQLRDAFEATTLDGLSGPIRFTPDSHSGLQPLALTVLVAAGDRWRLSG